MDAVIWFLVPLPFLNPACSSGSSWFTFCWPWHGEFCALLCYHVKWAQACSSLNVPWHCLSLGLEWKLTFSSPMSTVDMFRMCWHIECSTLTASSLRIWNSSAEIISPPLALFIVMLPKTHLISHSRMSGSRWLITLSWFSGSLRSFFV